MGAVGWLGFAETREDKHEPLKCKHCLGNNGNRIAEIFIFFQNVRLASVWRLSFSLVTDLLLDLLDAALQRNDLLVDRGFLALQQTLTSGSLMN